MEVRLEQVVLRLESVQRSCARAIEEQDAATVLFFNTIKTQTKSIYAKLGMHSRTKALAILTELHLL